MNKTTKLNPRNSRDKIVSMKFMRKYVHIAKAIKPTLTREAADYIADEYSKLRSQDNLQQDNLARVGTPCEMSKDDGIKNLSLGA